MAKPYEYHWSSEFWILAVQVERIDETFSCYEWSRHYEGAEGPREEKLTVKLRSDSQRFMISRSHPEETAVTLPLNDERFRITVFEVIDRAYYPAEPIFKSGHDAPAVSV